MKKTLQKGFSLVELLVVVAIIGVLAGVGIGLADLFGAFKPHTKEQDPAEQPPAQGTLTGVSTYGQQVATNTMMMTAGAS